LKELKVLAISDIHGKEGAAKAFVRDVRKRGIRADYLLIAGDIGCPEKPERGSKVLSILGNLKLEIYFVKGNWDIGLECAPPRTHNLDEEGPIKLGEYLLVGHGEKFDPYSVKGSVLLLTHYPPYGILDRGFKYEPYHRGTHTGLININDLIERYRPLLHIFGHSHKSGGVSLKLNGTTYVNVARLDRFIRNSLCIGNYSLITIREGEVKVEHFYINGVYKKCSRCNRRVLIPPSWNICKECMMSDELSVEEGISSLRGEVELEIEEIYPSGGGTLSNKRLKVRLKLPLTTIRNSLTLKELIEDTIRKEAFKVLTGRHKVAFSIPRDLLTYLYPCPADGSVGEPLIVRLFKCKRCRENRGIPCNIFKALLKRKVELFWAFDSVRGVKGLVKHRNYVLVTGKRSDGCDRTLIALIKNGFRILTAKVDPPLFEHS